MVGEERGDLAMEIDRFGSERRGRRGEQERANELQEARDGQAAHGRGLAREARSARTPSPQNARRTGH